jgi:RimJ/RimL family protein N-acetyltransferase
MTRPVDTHIEIATDRFQLRQMRPSDATRLAAGWTLDPVAAEMLNSNLQEWSEDAQRSYFQRYLKGQPKLILGIFVRENKQLIGIYIITTDVPNATFTSSIVIGAKSWRGQRAAAEVSKAIYHHLFNVLGYAKAKANVRVQNKPMLWLLLQQGNWKREARLKQQLLDRQSKTRQDLYVFGMLAEDWRASVHAKTQSFVPSVKL